MHHMLWRAAIPLVLMLVHPGSAWLGDSSERATFYQLTPADGVVLRYAIALPDRFESIRPYPAILALPEAPQDWIAVALNITRYGTQQSFGTDEAPRCPRALLATFR